MEQWHFLTSSTHTTLELVACVALILKGALDMAGVLRNYDPGPAGMTLCILVHSRVLTVIGSNGGITSVVMHTLDRYWRIVYPIHHRKHFRRWMLHVGLAVPWLIPLALHLPTAIISKVDRGKCYQTSVWPSQDVRTVCILQHATFLMH